MTIEQTEARAATLVPATIRLAAPPSPDIGEIRMHYRLAKSAEGTRNRLLLGAAAYVRVFMTEWSIDTQAAVRKKNSAAALQAVKRALINNRPRDSNGKPSIPLPETLIGVGAGEPRDSDQGADETPMLRDLAAPWWRFELERYSHRRAAEAMLVYLPATSACESIAGFSTWGLVAIIGEADDLGKYSGCRKLYKRLGLAPDECYPRGEKKTGRKIPRATRGRIMGIICDPLLRQQWRGERENSAAHAVGPYGGVYGEVKARALASGKTKGHADRLARRAMVKALIHDVHRAWHGLPLDYANLSVPGQA